MLGDLALLAGGKADSSERTVFGALVSHSSDLSPSFSL